MRQKVSYWTTIKRFMMKQTFIKLNLDIGLVRMEVQIPTEHHLFLFYIAIRPLFDFRIFSIDSAGWGIYFYKGRVAIHAKKIIIDAELGLSKTWVLHHKLTWMICRMTQKERENIKQEMDKV